MQDATRSRSTGRSDQASSGADMRQMVARGAGAAAEAFGMWTRVSQTVSAGGTTIVQHPDHRNPAPFSQSSATTSMSRFWFMICVIIPASAAVSSFADTAFSVAVATGVMLPR